MKTLMHPAGLKSILEEGSWKDDVRKDTNAERFPGPKSSMGGK